ncbi:MAG: N-acetylmuramoyl-L-alanine amidase [Sphingomonadales bacterium]
MARCPFAKWLPITGPVGNYVAGPYRIVHHTTEGVSAQGALDAFRKNRSDPHFTVDQQTIYQHIDTGLAARALRNLAGGVETNRLSAVQIEVVGTAAKPKPRATLENVARLCRWLEHTHAIPNEWPSGPPKPAINGKDPGGHNRNAQNWVRRGGHYGHSHVPENIHWDPGYTADEVTFLMRFDPDNRTALQDPAIAELRESFPEDVPLAPEDIAMPDHAEEGEPGEIEYEEGAPGRMPALARFVAPASAAVAAGAVFLGSYLMWRNKSGGRRKTRRR